MKKTATLLNTHYLSEVLPCLCCYGTFKVTLILTVVLHICSSSGREVEHVAKLRFCCNLMGPYFKVVLYHCLPSAVILTKMLLVCSCHISVSNLQFVSALLGHALHAKQQGIVFTPIMMMLTSFVARSRGVGVSHTFDLCCCQSSFKGL